MSKKKPNPPEETGDLHAEPLRKKPVRKGKPRAQHNGLQVY